MKYLINDIEPRSLFHFFEELCAIPRASYHEEAVAAYLAAFAEKRGLFCHVDEHKNVLIKKAATKGRELEAAVLLQAHTDMVTEKDFGSSHDFLKDALRLRREGDVLCAEGTTLGADDGFGVALMLTALDDATLSHPPLECLFTSAEEVGLVGASRFDYTRLSAKYMINLDGTEEDNVIVGCCGGQRCDLFLTAEKKPLQGGAVLELVVDGLAGGHSGVDVDKGRLNALKLMHGMLQQARERMPFQIADLQGGDKTNAIPRYCRAVLVFAEGDEALPLLQSIASEALAKVSAPEDSGLSCTVKEAAASDAFSYEVTDRVLALMAIQNGVLVRNEVGDPIASRNLASVRTEKSGLLFALSTRSTREALLQGTVDETKALAESIAAKADFYSRYPGWEGSADAPLTRAWQAAYAKASGGKVTAPMLVHAGLEAGIITSSVSGMSAVSVGCNVYDLHTPLERMELSSLARIYAALRCFLENPIA